MSSLTALSRVFAYGMFLSSKASRYLRELADGPTVCLCEPARVMRQRTLYSIRRALVLGAGGAMVTGCGTADRNAGRQAEGGTGMAFGAFDFRESDINATHVVLLRISPTKLYMGGAGERSTVTMEGGEFYALNLSPGLYAVNAFYSGELRVALEANLKQNTFRVEPGAAVYAGSYRVSYQRKGLFQRDDGAFERVDSRATEGRLLRWLATELAATDWAQPVRSRLSALERS